MRCAVRGALRVISRSIKWLRTSSIWTGSVAAAGRSLSQVVSRLQYRSCRLPTSPAELPAGAAFEMDVHSGGCAQTSSSQPRAKRPPPRAAHADATPTPGSAQVRPKCLRNHSSAMTSEQLILRAALALADSSSQHLSHQTRLRTRTSETHLRLKSSRSSVFLR